MIVRILHEGQFEMSDDLRDELERQDDPLEAATQSNDAVAFAAALDGVIAWVHAHATRLDEGTIAPSEYVIPAPGTPLSEVQALIDSETAGA